MKTITLMVATLIFILQIHIPKTAYSQNQFSGKWEGVFMGDFKTKIEFSANENNVYTGRIQMFSDKNLIQDDPISKIDITQQLLTFRIESKETDFRGKFNNDFTELSGVFVFPDKSEHPLKLLRKKDQDSAEENSAELYWDLRNKKYPADVLKDDLNFLIESLQVNHPDLYSHSSREKFNNMVNASMQQLNSEFTIIEFFKLIAPIVENIKCSHTGIRLPQDFQKEIYSYDIFFPLQLWFEGNKAFCVKSYDSSNTTIFPGNEVLSINDIPIQNIIQKLYTFIPSEGNNRTTKNYQLNQNFNSFYNFVDNSPTFKIEYIKSGCKSYTSLKACRYHEVKANGKAIQSDTPIKFFIDNENKTGFLTLKTFMIGDINQYIQKMDSIFLSLNSKLIEHLVIDLRGNSGGHPIFAAQLFSYLTDMDFTYFKRNTVITEFEPLYNTMQPNKLQFRGDIYVVCDGGCLSTTGHLISLIRHYTNAKFIGEEPGSTFRCNDFSTKIILPNTGIEVNIPRTTFETVIDNKDKIKPFAVDYKICVTAEDFMKGIDGCLDFINNLISKP